MTVIPLIRQQGNYKENCLYLLLSFSLFSLFRSVFSLSLSSLFPLFFFSLSLFFLPPSLSLFRTRFQCSVILLDNSWTMFIEYYACYYFFLIISGFVQLFETVKPLIIHYSKFQPPPPLILFGILL